MQNDVTSVEEYLAQLPSERKQAMLKLRQLFLEKLPKGFTETISYGMISYVVPHSIYPKGYHCNTEQPLPFISIASQKNYIALYHMGIYASPALLTWFEDEYPKHCKNKLDMGKSCIRFKKIESIPYELIAQLLEKMSVKEWIEIYENNLQPKVL